jgi:hypothetical protein
MRKEEFLPQDWPVPMVILPGSAEEAGWNSKPSNAVMEISRSDAEAEPTSWERMAMLRFASAGWECRWARSLLREAIEVGRAMSLGERFLLADQVRDSEGWREEVGWISSFRERMVVRDWREGGRGGVVGGIGVCVGGWVLVGMGGDCAARRCSKGRTVLRASD